MPQYKTLLFTLAALCSLLIAFLHFYIIGQGAWAYRFFGAGEELATLAAQGSWIPGAITSVMAVIFFIFAVYYFAGTGLVAHPPLFHAGLIGIAALYTIRGA